MTQPANDAPTSGLVRRLGHHLFATLLISEFAGVQYLWWLDGRQYRWW
jgi:hypothetical protein